MKERLPLTGILAALTALTLTNCAPQNNAQRDAAVGAAGGAAIGAIIGNNVGDGDAATGAAIGGALGGLGGFAHGRNVDQQQGRY